MTKQDNLAVQQKFASAVNAGELELLRDLVALDVVDHDPAPGQGAGPEGFIRAVSRALGPVRDPEGGTR